MGGRRGKWRRVEEREVEKHRRDDDKPPYDQSVDYLNRLSLPRRPPRKLAKYIFTVYLSIRQHSYSDGTTINRFR